MGNGGAGPLHRFAVPLPQGGRIKNSKSSPLGGSTREAGEGGLNLHPPPTAFPAKAGIQMMDHRPRQTVWLPGFAGKAEGS